MVARLLTASLVLAWLAGPVLGQVFDPRFAADSNLSLPVDPQLSTAIVIAEQAIGVQEWDRAINVLQLVLDADEDAFLAPEDPRSAQTRADELIGGLPPTGRQLYERLYAPAAEALLAAAHEAQHPRAYETVIRRYFHTPSGRQAAWRSAVLRQDQGAPLTAALLFEKLLADDEAARQYGSELQLRAAAAWLAAGATERAERQLDALNVEPDRPLTLAGRTVALPAEGGATLGWLRELTGVGAVAAVDILPADRDAAPPHLPPFLPPSGPPAWYVPPVCTDDVLANYPDRAAELNTALAELEQEQRDQSVESGRLLIPAPTPLVMGEAVLFRGPDRLSELSAADGSLRWTATPVDFTYRELAEKTEFSPREEMTRELYLGQRAWRDETSASLSCDGTLVYTVMDCGMIGVVDPGNPFQAGRHGKGAFRDNTLQAYSLQGGKQRWSIGGPVTPAEDPFAGLFFLGPPLPHEGRLYCLAEDRGQIRLLAIDPAPVGAPTLLWSQGLLNPSPLMDIEHHEGRRTSALRPVVHGNVLICPTGAGSVVAVDLTEQRLLWGTAYDEPAVNNVFRGVRRPPRVQQSLTERQQIALDRLLDAGRWRDCTPLWIGDYVLVPTPDADTLACLRASDGELLWDIPREDWLFIAGCALDHVVLVGTSSIGAVWLEDGAEAWLTRTPIPAPCGRGFEHDGLYTLPLSTGELATFDLRSGRLCARSPFPDGVVPGNLAVAAGRLVSQSASQVSAYAPVSSSADWLAALDAPAADPQTLALAGEALLHAGQTERGIAALRAALQRIDDVRPRLVLATVLTERLRVDYPAHRDLAPEVERLVAGTRVELGFHRLMTTQCRLHDEATEAFRHLLLIGASLPDEPPLEAVDDDLSVALDRWVVAQIQELLHDAAPAERDAMLARLDEEFRTLSTSQEPSVRPRLVSLAGLVRGTPLEPAVALELARRTPDDDPTERMRRWLDVRNSADAATQAEATLELARLCLHCADPALAAPYIDELRTTLADAPIAGATGAEWLARWEADAKLRSPLRRVPLHHWPAGELQVRAGPLDNSLPPFHVLPVVGPQEGPLAGWTFTYNDQKQQVAAYNPLGLFAWETSAGADLGPQPSVPDHVMIDGPLVVVYWPDRLQAISAITPGGGRTRPMRWSRNYVSRQPEMNGFFGQRGAIERAGVTGPLTAGLLCYQYGSSLLAVDPWTGRDAWRRTQPSISELLADDDYVVVRPQASGDMQVLRALDGKLAATRLRLVDPLTPPDDATWGRRYLTLTSIDDDTDRLAMYDPATGENGWERTLKSPAYWTTIDGGSLVLIDGAMECVILDPATGRELLRVALPGEQPVPRLLRSVSAYADAERIYLVLNEPQDSDVLRFEPQRGGGRTVNGRLFAIGRQSAQVDWTANVEGMYLDPLQPAAWPVLVLTSRQKTPDDGEFSSVQMVLEKASGRVLLDDRVPAEGSPRNFVRRVAWRVAEEGPLLRMTNDQRTLVIQPAKQPESEK